MSVSPVSKSGTPIVSALKKGADKLTLLAKEKLNNTSHAVSSSTSYSTIKMEKINTTGQLLAYLEKFAKPEEENEWQLPTLRNLHIGEFSDFTEETWQIITPYLKNLHHLTIETEEIEELTFPNSSSIKSITVPHILILRVDNCRFLEVIDAPRVKTLSAKNCVNLAVLLVTETENSNVLISQTPLLKKLTLPNTKTIVTTLSENLRQIDAPEATEIHLLNCPNFHTFKNSSIPKVEILTVRRIARRHLPEGIGTLKNLRVLTFENFYLIRELPNEIFLLPPTCTIIFKNCVQIKIVREQILETTQKSDYQGPKFIVKGD